MAVTGVSRTTFIPKLWEASVLRAYENKLVAKEICGLNPKAPITKYGDTVHFPGLADPTIGTYVPDGIADASATATTITYQNLTDSDVTLVIDQAKYFAFKVDDILEAQTEIGVRGSQTERAGYKLRDDADKYILGLAPAAVTAGSITAGQVVSGSITSANVISSIGEMKKIIEEANVPNEESFIVIPPWLKLKLHLAGIKFSILEGTKGVKNGIEWTNDLGFDMYVSNNLTETTASSTTTTHVVGGSKKAMCYAGQILNTEAMRLEGSFAYGVRGLHLYGAKIIRPELMTVGQFVEAAESTI